MSIIAATILDQVSKQAPAATSVLGTILSQLHAGMKIDAKVTFDIPGPLDPSISVSAVIAFDGGSLRLKELHVTPAS